MIKRLIQLGVLFLLGLCAGAASAQYVTLSGSLTSSNGMPAKNYIIQFKPSQFGFVAGTSVIVNTATSCATSVDGSVVGVPNPLVSPPASISFSGTLPAANYFVKFAFYDAAGNVTLPSPETQIQLSATGRVIVASPVAGMPSGAVGMNVYISTSSGTETLQGQATGSAAYIQSTPLVSGAAVPSTNTTICKQIANDVIWPSGTGYTVSMTDPSGNTIPGYPMQWQLMGAGTTINLSTGLPYYHGTVYFPTPILASPLNHQLQSISGPLSLGGYAFTAGSINGGAAFFSGIDNVLYADQCVGADIGMKINDCMAKLPLSGGWHVGTIILPNTGSGNATWATTVDLGPGVNLTGQGMLASSFNCTVAGDCLLYDASAPEHGGTVHAFTVGVASVLQGFTITGNGATGQNIFHFKDATNLTVRDVGADGATAAGSACFLLHDVNFWTERATFENVSSLFGCAIGWRFIADTTNPFAHPSFGYNRFLNIKANPNNGQTAFSFEGNSFIFNGTYRIVVNSDGPGTKIFHMQDGAEFFFNELHFDGETSNPAGTLLDITSASNQFTYLGDFVFGGGMPSTIVPGATVTHWMDSGGFSPQIINSTQFAINSAFAQQIGPGSDLNNVGHCGKYEGSASINTPLAIGSQFYRLDVVCGGQLGQQAYLTQIIYTAQFTFGVNKVYYRVRDNGVWYPWRQMGFTTDLPTSGTTGALPGGAIAAGSCTSLSAIIGQAEGTMGVVASPNSTTQLISGLHWDTAYISATNGPLMLANDPAGTALNHIVMQSANGNVLTTTTGTIGGLLGICTAGCGTTGTATITTRGTANVVYDGATTSGDFVINSTTIPGAAHDFGPSPIGVTSQILGQVLSTNGAAGTYATQLNTSAPASVTVTVPVCNLTGASITPNITPTFNVRLIP